ncbi:MAG: DoxX family membrane protein [Chthoniobacterales bacterium]|nr:DoxX family membrane protein [Chthoniobacterales bacterium]
MRTATVVLLRLLLGGLFLWAGLSKLEAPLQTLASVYSYQIVLPDLLASLIAAALPWMEILLGLALLAGIWLPVATGWTAAVLFFFTVMTAQAWWRGLPIDCGCVDLSQLHPALAALTTPGGATLRNIVLLGLTAVLALLSNRKKRAA